MRQRRQPADCVYVLAKREAGLVGHWGRASYRRVRLLVQSRGRVSTTTSGLPGLTSVGEHPQKRVDWLRVPSMLTTIPGEGGERRESRARGWDELLEQLPCVCLQSRLGFRDVYVPPLSEASHDPA